MTSVSGSPDPPRPPDPRDELVQALLGLRWALPRTDGDARVALDQLGAVVERLSGLGPDAQAPWEGQVQGLLAQAGFALDWWRPVLDDMDLDWTLNHQAHLSADLARIASAGARILDQYAPSQPAMLADAHSQPPSRHGERVAAAFGSVPASTLADPLANSGRHRRPAYEFDGVQAQAQAAYAQGQLHGQPPGQQVAGIGEATPEVRTTMPPVPPKARTPKRPPSAPNPHQPGGAQPRPPLPQQQLQLMQQQWLEQQAAQQQAALQQAGQQQTALQQTGQQQQHEQQLYDQQQEQPQDQEHDQQAPEELLESSASGLPGALPGTMSHEQWAQYQIASLQLAAPPEPPVTAPAGPAGKDGRPPQPSQIVPPIVWTGMPQRPKNAAGVSRSTPAVRRPPAHAGMVIQAVGILGVVGVLSWWALTHLENGSNSPHNTAAGGVATATNGSSAKGNPAASADPSAKSGTSGTHSAAPPTTGASTGTGTVTGTTSVTALQVSLLGGSETQRQIAMVLSVDTSGKGQITVTVDYYGKGANGARVDERTASWKLSGKTAYQIAAGIPTGDYCGDLFTLTADSESATATQTTNPGC